MPLCPNHPEHDRTSCSDENTNNTDPEGSTGCARCTAIDLHRGAEAIAFLRLVEKNLRKGMSKSIQKLQARNIEEFFKENHLAN